MHVDSGRVQDELPSAFRLWTRNQVVEGHHWVPSSSKLGTVGRLCVAGARYSLNSEQVRRRFQDIDPPVARSVTWAWPLEEIVIDDGSMVTAVVVD